METTCQVSLDAITQNFSYFKKRVYPAQVIPVVKANAYGHGALKITEHLHEVLGVETFAVATLEEARELAVLFPHISILIFSRVFPSELPDVPEHAILTVGSVEDAKSISESQSSNIRVHLNVNTGMNRLGITSEQAQELISWKTSNLQIEGVYSHFSSSDTSSEVVYARQNDEFTSLVEKLRAGGFQGMAHLANSAAGLHNNQKSFDAIRLGIGLYGYDTSPEGKHQTSLQPAMTIKAPLIRIAKVSAGESVSYAEKWQAAVDTNIGTLRIGYADGYVRALTNRGLVAYNGKSYPVVGTVTMDHIMIDLGQDEPTTGAMFEVMGGAIAAVQINRISNILNTIPYEICCSISPRVKRNY
ncbi:MAG: alanine racemase [Candidatus Marinimicrobia bacterium]|jgi:alanine racemase|nr:alanine racemase [Candidatus Neomarinimicrobiota bacterium]MBT3631536.1 alanine racemase [Candidatus Neomarinimicrobiota bacterium]MBT3824535.1 alanine racemase [Candidatus Neomarinimicrobiota bacterium]MBT4131331.1 alanine racemase [Candidatus Neomarinimicrobiota bacterium]MBT7199851.1 alanine racemase [Candidatus Neomarinimicrobiota bacterium]